MSRQRQIIGYGRSSRTVVMEVVGFLRQHFAKFIMLGGLLCVLIAGIVTYWYPWVWYGSKQAYGIATYGSIPAYNLHEQMTFSVPRSRIAYAEDPNTAKRLKARFYSQARQNAVSEWSFFTFWPDDIGVPSCGMIDPVFMTFDGLVFLHERTSSNGLHRLVAICFCSRDVHHSGIFSLGLRAHTPGAGLPVDSPDWWLGFNRFELTSNAGYITLYFGEVDTRDQSHFTIKYEIDHLPGVIDGWLQTDGTLKIQVRDGTAATKK